jgi:hypothetical protein
MQFLIKKTFHLYFFLHFLVIKTLDPDPDSLKMLDLDPYPDPDSIHSSGMYNKKIGMPRFLFRNSESRSAARTMRSSR